MKHWLSIIVILCCAAGMQAQTVKDLQQEQKKLQQQIQQTDKMLGETKKNEKATANKLNLLNKDIKDRKRLISNINSEINVLNRDINDLTTRRTELQSELGQLQQDYAQLVRATHYADMQASPLMFLFSADNFQQLMRRIRYMQQFQQYRKNQVAKIQQVQNDIDIQNSLLTERRETRTQALNTQKREHDNLTRTERKQQQMLNELKKKEKDLTAQLKKQQKKAEEINRKIDDLIRKQAASTTTLTKEQQLIAGGFEKNKGLLPWPVEKGFISGTFGTHPHPIYPDVTINNKGIYLQTQSGSSARAVYEGEVSACLVLGSTFAVIVQHGNYRTVYSNLDKLYVKQGDKVQPKQALGRILTDSNEDNKTELFFQIYQDRTLLNPTPWLAK